MTNIRRFYDEGHACFLTHVTYGRLPILIEYFDLLWRAIERVGEQYPFTLEAWVVLPDHMHLVIGPGVPDLSGLMRRSKLSFSTFYRTAVGVRKGRVWQYRFWDHMIRDQEDMNRHLDYVHYNPVKHGLTDNPFVWKHSSAVKFLQDGYYQEDWGGAGSINIDGDYGE